MGTLQCYMMCVKMSGDHCEQLIKCRVQTHVLAAWLYTASVNV